MKFFWQKNKKLLGETHEAREGTFRCEICGFIQPAAALCGTATDTQESPRKTYAVCSTCALWLGFGTAHFPPSTTFTISARQHDKIKALQDEFEKCGGFERTMMQITAPTDINSEKCRDSAALHRSFEQTHVFLDGIPMLKSLIKFRFSVLSANLMDLSIRLTRGEPVTPKEIRNANK
ncbi:MAG: hypothetical protein FWE97_01630 [Dehalococcoidia bacterium]|nr:hypothetical protein [Dehalococcoidia bacterium]